jgi:hypothetical protein
VSTHPLVTMRAKLEMGRFYLRARKMSEATSHITDALRSAMAIWDAMPEMSQEAKTAWHILATRIREIAEDSVSILNVWKEARNARKHTMSTGVLALALGSIVGVVTHAWFQPDKDARGSDVRVHGAADDDTGEFSAGI